jgi:hypothetical protein
MPNTTVFLLDIIDSNSLHGPVRELPQDNGISNQIKSINSVRDSNPIAVFPHMISLNSASNITSFLLNPLLKLRHTC